MKITIEIPDAMLEPLREQLGQDVPRAVKEALAVALYQAGKLSIGRIAELLGTSIYEADGLMKRWHVDAKYSFEDFERDRALLQRLIPTADAGAGSTSVRAG